MVSGTYPVWLDRQVKLKQAIDIVDLKVPRAKTFFENIVYVSRTVLGNASIFVS